MSGRTRAPRLLDESLSLDPDLAPLSTGPLILGLDPTLVGNQAMQEAVGAQQGTSEAEATPTPVSQAPAGGTEAEAGEPEDERSWDLDLWGGSLTGPLGPLDLSLDTGRAELSGTSGGWTGYGGYRYGSDIYGGVRGPNDLSGEIGFNPDSMDLSLRGAYDGFSGNLGVNVDSGAFRLGAGYEAWSLGAHYDPTTRSGGGHLSYGAPMLPTPDALSTNVYAGEAAGRAMLGDLGGALHDPLGYAERHGDNIGAIGSTASMLGSVAAAQDPDAPRFGAGLSVSHGANPALGNQTDTRVMGSLQARF